MHADVVIVGAGPAGLATAIHAARRGLAAVVVERGAPPVDKACGEGVMPCGVAALARLGVDVAGLGVPFEGVRFVDGEVAADATFPDGDGLGIRRTDLARALLERATALGVTLLPGTSVTGFTDDGAEVRVRTDGGTIVGRWLVGADGVHSAVREAAGLALPPRGRPRYGVRRHFAVLPWSSRVEVHWADGAEAYVTPVASHGVGVALLWGGGGSFDELLERFPALRARIGHAPPLTPARGAGPFRQRVRRRFAGRVALVGDAAGYLDPLTGEGITLGLRSAEALVETLAAGRPLADYERAWRRTTRAYFVATSALLAVAARPPLRRRLIRTFAADPRLFERFLAVASGSAPLASIGPASLARVVRGVVRPWPADQSAMVSTTRTLSSTSSAST